MKKKRVQLYRGELEKDKPQDWGKPGISLEPNGKTICLILEGAYPYVAGGVSSWIQQIVKNMPGYDFKILTIMASRDQINGLKYDFPENIIEFRTIYLFDYLNVREHKRKRRIRLSDYEKAQLRKFTFFDTSVDWKTLTQLVCDEHKIGNTVDFLMSRTFFDEMCVLYNEKFDSEGFNIFFWTFRSMLATLICVMQQPLPDADIYHAISTGYAGLLGLIGKFTYNRPFILTEHGIYAREREEEILKADWVRGVYKHLWIDYFYFLSVGAYVNADKTIALFEHNRQIQISLGVPQKKALVIPNGVDPSAFPKHKTERTHVNIGAILRVVPIKDVKTLIRAFNYVAKKYPAAKLFLIGPEEEEKEYARECHMLVEDLGMTDSIIFTGRVNIMDFMPEIDIVVLTSISEAQPLVILESYACQTPVVATDVGSCRELVEGIQDDYGIAGIITKPVSPRETADALLRLCEDAELRKLYGMNGYNRAMNVYHSKIMFKTYNKLYREHIAGLKV